MSFVVNRMADAHELARTCAGNAELAVGWQGSPYTDIREEPISESARFHAVVGPVVGAASEAGDGS